MNETHSSSWWSVQLPAEWTAEEVDECVNVYSASGVGALQISAYKKSDGVIGDELLVGYAERERSANCGIERVSCGELSGYSISETTDGSFWQKWWIGSGQLLLFVTYNCRLSDKGSEFETVSEILGTLKSKLQAAT